MKSSASEMLSSTISFHQSYKEELVEIFQKIAGIEKEVDWFGLKLLLDSIISYGK